MRISVLLPLLGILLASGCSHESLQRTGYETMRNVEQQRCLEQQGTSPCPKGEGYDEYQRRRQELEKPQ